MRSFRCISVELNAKRLCKFSLQSTRTSNICGCTKTSRYLAAFVIANHSSTFSASFIRDSTVLEMFLHHAFISFMYARKLRVATS